MIFFLWGLVVLLLFLFLQERKNQGMILQKMLYFLPSRSKNDAVLKRISKVYTFKTHSWLVQQLSPSLPVHNRLKHAGAPISYKEYLNIKEGVLRLFSLFLFCFLLFGHPTWGNTLLFVFYFCFFFFLIDLVLQIMKERREKIFTREVPYFIDLFILTLRTGMNIQQALWCTTGNKSLLARTIRHQMEELNFGRSLNEIFEDLEHDVQNEEFQHFLRSVRQSQTLGVSLAYTLEVQSQLIRTKRQQRAEELSRTAAVKISLPLVLFIFPALLIIYIGPGILNIL